MSKRIHPYTINPEYRERLQQHLLENNYDLFVHDVFNEQGHGSLWENVCTAITLELPNSLVNMMIGTSEQQKQMIAYTQFVTYDILQSSELAIESLKRINTIILENKNSIEPALIEFMLNWLEKLKDSTGNAQVHRSVDACLAAWFFAYGCVNLSDKNLIKAHDSFCKALARTEIEYYYQLIRHEILDAFGALPAYFVGENILPTINFPSLCFIFPSQQTEIRLLKLSTTASKDPFSITMNNGSHIMLDLSDHKGLSNKLFISDYNINLSGQLFEKNIDNRCIATISDPKNDCALLGGTSVSISLNSMLLKIARKHANRFSAIGFAEYTSPMGGLFSEKTSFRFPVNSDDKTLSNALKRKLPKTFFDSFYTNYDNGDSGQHGSNGTKHGNSAVLDQPIDIDTQLHNAPSDTLSKNEVHQHQELVKMGDLVQYEDAEFIQEVYRHVLKQEAGPGDIENGLEKLSTMKKWQVIRYLRESDRGRACRVVVKGLESLVLKNAKQVMLGYLLIEDGKKFLEVAYKEILNSTLDNEGLKHFLPLLENKTMSKEEIIQKLRYSEAGRILGVNIVGLPEPQ